MLKPWSTRTSASLCGMLGVRTRYSCSSASICACLLFLWWQRASRSHAWLWFTMSFMTSCYSSFIMWGLCTCMCVMWLFHYYWVTKWRIKEEGKKGGGGGMGLSYIGVFALVLCIISLVHISWSSWCSCCYIILFWSHLWTFPIWLMLNTYLFSKFYVLCMGVDFYLMSCVLYSIMMSFGLL